MRLAARRLIVALAVSFLLVGCRDQDKTQSKGSQPEISLPVFEELPRLKEEAMSGSVEAALRLALWYGKRSEGRDTRAYWNEIAAENGSSVGQYNLALVLLGDDSDPLNRKRAMYWLESSAKQGDPDASELLLSLKKQEK